MRLVKPTYVSLHFVFLLDCGIHGRGNVQLAIQQELDLLFGGDPNTWSHRGVAQSASEIHCLHRLVVCNAQMSVDWDREDPNAMT